MVTRTQQAALNEVSDSIARLKHRISWAEESGFPPLDQLEKEIQNMLTYLKSLESKYSITIDHTKIKQELVNDLFEKAGKMKRFSWQAEFGLKHGL